MLEFIKCTIPTFSCKLNSEASFYAGITVIRYIKKATLCSENMHGYLFTDVFCLEMRTAGFPRANLEENCELQRTNNVQG